MKDTSAETRAEYRRTFETFSPETRARMGFEMFDFARKCARAGLRADYPHASDMEIEQKLFLRMYFNELPWPIVERALARIARNHAEPPAR